MCVSNRLLHLYLTFYHNAEIQINSQKIFKILLLVSYCAGLCKQEFIIPPRCLAAPYLSWEDELPKAENIPTWQRCSFNFRTSSSVQPYFLSAYNRPGPVDFLSFLYITLYCHSLYVSWQFSAITLSPINLKDSQRLGPCPINWHIARDSMNVYEWKNKW